MLHLHYLSALFFGTKFINSPCGSWFVSLSLWIDTGIVLWTAVPTGGNRHLPEAPPVAICPKSLTRQTWVHGIRLTMSVDKLHLAPWYIADCTEQRGHHFVRRHSTLLGDGSCSFVPFYDTLLCSTATGNRSSCAVHDPSCGMAEHHFSASRYSLHRWHGGSWLCGDVMRRVRVGVRTLPFSIPLISFL